MRKDKAEEMKKTGISEKKNMVSEIKILIDMIKLRRLSEGYNKTLRKLEKRSE